MKVTCTYIICGSIEYFIYFHFDIDGKALVDYQPLFCVREKRKATTSYEQQQKEKKRKDFFSPCIVIIHRSDECAPLFVQR